MGGAAAAARECPSPLGSRAGLTGSSAVAAGWEQAAAGFPEIPRGKSARAIWINPAVYPLFVTIGTASVVCGGFLFKYFTGHTDIAFSKSVRMDPNHQGGTDGRVASHNSHWGMREINKKYITIFPFSWIPKSAIIEARRTE